MDICYLCFVVVFAVDKRLTIFSSYTGTTPEFVCVMHMYTTYHSPSLYVCDVYACQQPLSCVMHMYTTYHSLSLYV